LTAVTVGCRGAVAAKRFSGSALVPVHHGEFALPGQELLEEGRLRLARPAMKIKKDRIAYIALSWQQPKSR